MRQINIVTTFLAAGLALGICGIADAKRASTAKPSGVHGIIISVQSSANRITVRTGSAKKGGVQTLHIIIGEGVSIQARDNSSASFSSLHAGDRVIIEPDADNPTTIVDLGSGKERHARKA